MNAASAPVRVVAALGLVLLVAALVYAISNGRLFLFPFLLLVGFPMAAVFRVRRPPPPSGESLPPPPRPSLN
jgi:hypothetical protein